jgi:uncharacterized protein YybS (DUF2232 family)
VIGGAEVPSVHCQRQRILYLLAGTLVTVLLQLAAGVLGPFGMLFNLLTMVPVSFACMVQGGAVAGGIVFLTTVTIAGVSGAEGSLAYLLQFGLGSLLLSQLLRRGWAWDRAVAVTLVTVIGLATLIVGSYLVSQGESVTGTINQYVQTEIKRALAASAATGQSEAELAELTAMAEQMSILLTRIYPGLAVTVTGVILLLTVFLLAKLSRGRYVIPGPPFPLWKTPEHLVWLLIVGGFGSLLTDGWVQVTAWNLLAVALPLYFLQGMSVISYFFLRKGFSPFMRGLGYLLLLVINPFQLLVAGIGVFDLWVDFRKPRIKKT